MRYEEFDYYFLPSFIPSMGRRSFYENQIYSTRLVR